MRIQFIFISISENILGREKEIYWMKGKGEYFKTDMTRNT